VLNSRHLLFEAQLAHYYGLSTELALSSVTTTPAKAAGLSHRIGFLSKGKLHIEYVSKQCNLPKYPLGYDAGKVLVSSDVQEPNGYIPRRCHLGFPPVKPGGNSRPSIH
jgi:hypothetical protein